MKTKSIDRDLVVDFRRGVANIMSAALLDRDVSFVGEVSSWRVPEERHWLLDDPLTRTVCFTTVDRDTIRAVTGRPLPLLFRRHVELGYGLSVFETAITEPHRHWSSTRRAEFSRVCEALEGDDRATAVIPIHWHQYDELLWVVEGAGRILVGGESLAFSGDEKLYIGDRVLHGGYVTANTIVVGLFQLDDELLTAINPMTVRQ